MKVLERFVLDYLRTVTSHLSDPHQFAYQSNRSVDDAVALGIHYMLQHLDIPKSYVLMLFVDYSSAFNTIIPGKLYDKLLNMKIDISICQWVLDFLLQRPQSVRKTSIGVNYTEYWRTARVCFIPTSVHFVYKRLCIKK